MTQRITVLGSTGSIGTNTLDVIGRHPDRFSVFALSAATRVEQMLAQCVRFRPRYAVMSSVSHGRQLAEKVKAIGLDTRVMCGSQALETIASDPEVDAVMAAIVGAAGLPSSLAAARAGKRLLLANKEALVVGADVFLEAVRIGGATLLPIDSEHSAIFQALPEDASTWTNRIEKLLLTSSGGPFRTREPATLRDALPEEACSHPNWIMGRKISVDSATMMNKALEVIEARYLFGVEPDRIEVVIHPQQIIHSMVQYRDASVVAQLGTPDMRVPIAYGLSWPERIDSGVAPLDFSTLAAMTFESPDAARFPGLQLAWDAMKGPSGTTAVLNAANEVAVQAFLDRRIRFDQIHSVNLATLENSVVAGTPTTFEDLMSIDRLARVRAIDAVDRMPRD